MKTAKNRWGLLLLGVLLAIAISLRLFKINNPLTEWFSWRQTDTAAVGRFLIRSNFNLLKPQYYDLSNIQSGHDNPQGLRMVEFPIYALLFALPAKFIPALSLEVWARLVTIIFSLAILTVVFKILEREFGLAEAFFGGLYFAVSPYIVYYSRSILPDMPATSFALMAIYSAYSFYKGGKVRYLLLSALLMALGLLVKPTVIFYALPIAYLILKQERSLVTKLWQGALFGLLAFVPLLVWRLYIRNFPEGIPYNAWLLTSVNTGSGLQPVFFRPSFFRWIFFERINNLLLGGYLVFLLILGIFADHKKTIGIHLFIALAALLYLFTFQGGNVQHDYYQILITPALALLVGTGAGMFVKHKKMLVKVGKTVVVLLLFIISSAFSYYTVKGYYSEQHSLVVTAEVIRSLTNQRDLIVTDTMGDTTLLYLADRRGFPAPYKELPDLKAIGAKYFVTYNQDYKNKLDGQYSLIFQNDQVLIFAL